VDGLHVAIQEAEVFAREFGLTVNGQDGPVAPTSDPVLQKIIEVASEFLEDPQIQGAFDFTFADGHFSR
jgi:hypothetical protein